MPIFIYVYNVNLAKNLVSYAKFISKYGKIASQWKPKEYEFYRYEAEEKEPRRNTYLRYEGGGEEETER